MPRIRTIKPELWLQTDTRSKPEFSVYCIAESGSEDVGPCKIGIATHMNKRLSALQGGNFRPLTLVWQIRVSDRNQAKDTEQHCLGRFRPSPYSPKIDCQLESEWVSSAPLIVLSAAVEYLRCCCQIERAA